MFIGQNYIVRIQKYETKDGLSNRQVNAIIKDRRGLLWIGTKYGLNSFDGYNFKTYTKEKDGLPFNYIDHILEDSDGKLWLMGPAGKPEIALFDPITKKSEAFETKFKTETPALSGSTINKQKTLYLSVDKSNDIYTYKPSDGLSKKNLRQFAPVSSIFVGPKN
ncbi:MAG: hybrid sensor histidine kinase/response regulator, partial [Bacteroidia bacterium]|nr:hybrid sensor histidine kinase/response regulator [Bacteroidia bacterium]